MTVRLKLDPSAADTAVILDGLVAYNRQASGRPAGWQPFALLLEDPGTGAPVGGLSGETLFDWMVIELFHVPEAMRGQGHGRELMQAAETFARERGLIGIWVDTFAFQARGFYEKLGFTVFGTLDDQPPGGARYFLKKRLDTPASR